MPPMLCFEIPNVDDNEFVIVITKMAATQYMFMVHDFN